MSHTHGKPEDPGAEAVAAATWHWLRRAVLGLNLCPFAHEPVRHQRLRLHVSAARTADDLLQDLESELIRLRDANPAELETTLLVHPHVLQHFPEYSDFLPVADLAVRMLGLTGQVQIASFHPQYQFAGTTANDVSNATNQAPYPCLHLLREASIERAVASLADPDAIYQRNMATLAKLGWAGWHDWLSQPPEGLR